ncbi:unnamed protein product [Amaranthus hypochondriacus]
MYRPGSNSGSGGYGDDRYEGNYDERNGYGREREWGNRDDERYGPYGDSYNREGDRYGRDSEEHYGRDRYGDDDSRGRTQSVDDYQNGSRSRSSDRNGGRAYDDDDRQSARGSSVRGEDQNDGRPIERKFSEQNLGAPPSYEEAVGVSRSPAFSDRDGEGPTASALQSSSPTVSAAPQSSSPVAYTTPQSTSPNGIDASQVSAEHAAPSDPNVGADTFDEFDPRGSLSVAPTTSSTGELDLLGSLSDAFFPSPLAIMPASGPSDVHPDSGNTASNPSFTAASEINNINQSFEDPFGDSPFKAIPSDEAPTQPQNFASSSSFHPAVNPSEHLQPAVQTVESPNLEFADAFPGLTYNPATVPDQTPNPQYYRQEPQSMQDDDILAGILPPSAPLPRAASLGAFPASSGIPQGTASQSAIPSTVHTSAGLGFMAPVVPPTGAPFSQVPSQNFSVPSSQHNSFSYPAPSNALAHQAPVQASSNENIDLIGDMLQQPSAAIPISSQLNTSSTGSLALVPQQPAKEKFEPKSAVWADTLNRGLVNLNISGPKINPLSDIGIDFESLNRKEKRMEKPSATPATSNVAMGKAMGSGSGMGRASTGAMRPPPNAMLTPGMGMGISMGGPGVGMNMGMNMGMGRPGVGMNMGMGGPGVGMGIGSYGPVNHQVGMGMGGMGGGMNMAMPMNMNMGQGAPMQPSNGLAPGSNMNNYNSMMGRGGYPQQPYGGGY